MKQTLRLEKIVAPVLVCAAGFVIGYAMQQNRGFLDQIPNGIGAALVYGNGAILFSKDICRERIDSDLKYLAIGNAAGAAGYFSGLVKDCLFRC